ncbi:hypothetical protein [Nakamurella leprariae]|uniref:DUF2530 domain-containing protein n=1 Tax=Nakamurella leprariae TaxID=2803911 RepID=A0A939BXU1_9ACTN|nr:hypothetical protein [Nakamurella leprariae]MBM9468908.1 hypothetical protein [Nakamurella leprariae]
MDRPGVMIALIVVAAVILVGSVLTGLLTDAGIGVWFTAAAMLIAGTNTAWLLRQQRRPRRDEI